MHVLLTLQACLAIDADFMSVTCCDKLAERRATR